MSAPACAVAFFYALLRSSVLFITSDMFVFMTVFVFSLSPSFVLCLPLLLLLYPADFQQDGCSSGARSCSRFLPVNRECFLGAGLTWGFRLRVSASVTHPETV